MEIWNNWVLMGLLAAAAWALSCVVDVCFIGEGIYREPVDGPLTAGVFCIVPLLLYDVPVDPAQTVSGAAWVAMGAGACFLLHLYFNFKALFEMNDATNAEIFNTLSVILVPILAFVLLGEVLGVLSYLAIALSVAGILLLIRFQVGRLTGRVAVFLAASVFFVSLMMVLQAGALEYLDYSATVWWFSLAATLGVAMLLLRATLRHRLAYFARRYGLVLAAVQMLEFGGVLGSQRATDVGPSVSLVALLECSLPVFVMAFSWLLLATRPPGIGTSSPRVRSALAAQTTAYPAKLTSLALIVAAIGLVQVA